MRTPRVPPSSYVPLSFANALPAVRRRVLALRQTALAYLLLVAMSMSVAAGVSKLQTPSTANHQPNVDCSRDTVPSCIRPTLV